MEVGDIYGLIRTPSGFQEINLNDYFSGGGYTILGEYYYHAQSSTADTAGDWRQYADDNGFYTQYWTVGNATKGAGTWITKHTIQV